VDIVRPGTRIDFVGQARIFAVVSAIVFVAAVLLMVLRGWNLGIDFAGGTVLQVQIPVEAGEVEEGRIRAAVGSIGFPDASVVRFGAAEDRSYLVTVSESKQRTPDLESRIVAGLSERLGAEVVRQRTESIGPRVGSELRRAGIGALLLAWGLILIYVWLLEFNLQVLAALLVVIGYSLNDTIVIYDRIRENLELRGTTHLEEVVNQSLNQTLSRTLLTSLTTLVVVVALLLLGGPVLRDFALAMLIGVLVGTYSTVYVASSLLILLERRFPHTAKAAA
jgi:preprotein translocase subunit SecF